MSVDDAVAIIGMDCIFPGAGELATYVHNLCVGVDAISDAPVERFDPAFYAGGSPEPDRVRCRRGGFIDAFARFDPLPFGIMPIAAKGAEPDQLLSLKVAARALADAGYARNAWPKQRTGVVIGRGNYPGPGRIRLEQHVRGVEQLSRALRELVPGVEPAELARIEREYRAQIDAAHADAVIGLVPNLTASRLANRLDLDGPAYTLDAACASALIALERACQDLRTHSADLMICGGVHTCHEEAFASVFSQLGALSASQAIRPLDQRADGLLIGEGVGMVVLKRARDAFADGDRIYALVRGIGSSSDGKAQSPMSPAIEGQMLALSRAWQASGLDPIEIGLLEAHGTATPAGDAAELQTLRAFFGPRAGAGAGIGSVKSMIGHAMPAAGIAGLIKVAAALHAGVRPCTLHCEKPHPLLAETAFYPLHATERWDARRRVAGVNAFGFGGINAHVVLEAVERGETPRTRAARATQHSNAPSSLTRPLRIAAPSREQLLERLARGEQGGEGRHRLALTDPDAARILRARELVARSKRIDGRQGFFYGFDADGSEPDRIAFLYPGLDANFEPHVADVASHFQLEAPDVRDLSSLEGRGIAVMQVNALIERALAELNLRADAVAGHSIGEWNAMIASGVLEREAIAGFHRSLRPGSLAVAHVGFAALACEIARADALLTELPEIEISHDNCKHQVLCCGAELALAELERRALAAGVPCQRLPFGSGVHTRFFAAQLATHVENIRGFRFSRARIPLYSATSCAPYPDDPEAITALAIAHMVERVRFRELIERLYADGFRLFVQVGAGSLAGFVEDTLHARPHAAIAANVAQRSGLAQLLRVACLSWVRGGEPDFDKLCGDRAAIEPGIALRLGVPLVHFDRPLRVGFEPRAEATPPAFEGALGAALSSSLHSLELAQTQVAAALAQRNRSARPARLHRRIGLDVLPELRDHAFFRQPPGWPDVSDTGPVVPMTATIELMLEAARSYAPEREIIALEELEALRWLAIAEPVELEIELHPERDDRVLVRIGDYARAFVRFGTKSAEALAPRAVALTHERAAAVALTHERAAAIDARALYDQGWMFHGPAYQGIARLGPIARDGIRGELRAGPALGSLLDNAGQLLGYWTMIHTDRDRLAMPIKLRSLRFIQPPPAPGEPIECCVSIRKLDPTSVEADMTLSNARGVCALLEGWQDRRFATDAALFDLIREPAQRMLAATPSPGLAILDDGYESGPSRDYLAGRYLDRHERERYAELAPRDRRGWLSTRIAQKDAARSYAFASGRPQLFPVEVELTAASSDPSSDPSCALIGGERGQRLACASAQHEHVYAAVVGASTAAVRIEPIAIEPTLAKVYDPMTSQLLGGDEPRVFQARCAAARALCQADAIVDRRQDALLTAVGWIETLHHDRVVIAWISR